MYENDIYKNTWIKENHKNIIPLIWIFVLIVLLNKFFNLDSTLYLLGVLLTLYFITLANQKKEKKTNITSELVPWIHQLIEEIDEDEKERIYFHIYDKIRSESLNSKTNIDHSEVLKILKYYKPITKPYPSNLANEKNYGISVSFE